MRYTTTLVCVVVAAVALTGEPAAAQLSHQGQDISDHVVLRDGSLSGRGPGSVPFDRVFQRQGAISGVPGWNTGVRPVYGSCGKTTCDHRRGVEC